MTRPRLRRLRARRLQILVAVVISGLLVVLGFVLVTRPATIRDDFSPKTGAWFGGAVNLDSERDNEASGNPRDVVTRQSQLCRKFDNLHYYLYGLAVPDVQLENVRWAIEENETPLVTLSWPQRMPSNPDFIPQVASGNYDQEIAITAARIKALDGRVILRPFWEFNHADNGLGAANYGGDHGQFIKAWQRTHAIFFGDAATWRAMNIRGSPVDAANVRFSWTPGAARPNIIVDGVSEDYRPYYPGDQYVDWIGIDSYTSNRMVYLRDVFLPPTQLVDWYATYAPRGKPMTVSEIGIQPQSSYPNRSPSRAEWYGNAQAALKELPMIKLFSYFDVSNDRNPLRESYQVDAPGGAGDDSAGRALAAYSALANDPHFRPAGGGSGCDPAPDQPATARTSSALATATRGRRVQSRWAAIDGMRLTSSARGRSERGGSPPAIRFAIPSSPAAAATGIPSNIN